jgi:hypothetical protein
MDSWRAGGPLFDDIRFELDLGKDGGSSPEVDKILFGQRLHLAWWRTWCAR